MTDQTTEGHAKVHGSEAQSKVEKVSDKKDAWDKAGVIAQFLSGTVIGLLGVLISLTVDRAQHDADERQQFVDYLKAVSDASGTAAEDRRATMIANLDLAIPKEAVRVAAQYAINDPSQRVRDQAMEVLTKFPREGNAVLQRIAANAAPPDRQLAAIYLGRTISDVFVRLSDIDDDGHLTVNGREVVTIGIAPYLGNDSGWREITSALRPGINTIVFVLHNGVYGGWSGRLQISAGQYQYDSTKLSSPNCPCNSNAFRITARLDVKNNNSLNGLKVQPVEYFAAETPVAH